MSAFAFCLVLLFPSLFLSACSDDAEKYVPDGPVNLSVTRDGAPVSAIDFGTYGGDMLLTLESNDYWDISLSGDGDTGWLKLSNRSGEPTVWNDAEKPSEPRYISLSASPLGSDPSRSCVVTFRAGNEAKTVTVTQTQPAEADASGWESAYIACRNMKVGLNLYNTLDAVGDWFDQEDVFAFETCWGQPVTTQAWFDAVAAAGFRAVRIPVTWHPHMDANWVIKEPWINRVEEVVGYALNSGLYCILNVHHDTGADGWLCADLENIESISEKFGSLWHQIATRFNSYGEKLVFEGYNEMLDAKNSWVEPVEGGYEAVNLLAQKFVDTVRATGGNNEHRNLIVNTYGGGNSRTRFDNLRIPEDRIAGHLMVECHNYSPSKFSNLNGEIDDDNLPVWTKEFEASLGAELDIMIDFATRNNIPVIIGECSAYEKIADEEKAKYGEFLTSYSKGKADVCCFYWSGLIDRTTGEKIYPLLVDAFVRGAN